MFTQVRDRIRTWWHTRNMLIVNFGNREGRVPLVMLSRDEVFDVTQKGALVSFSTHSPHGAPWIFEVRTTSADAAEEVACTLKRRSRYILEALDPITCITHTRPEDGILLPRLVGGDISIAAVPNSEYWQNDNGAWMLRALLPEPKL